MCAHTLFRKRTLPSILAACIFASAICVVQLRSPMVVRAYDCPTSPTYNCLEKAIWEGGRGTFRGGLTTMTVPLVARHASNDG